MRERDSPRGTTIRSRSFIQFFFSLKLLLHFFSSLHNFVYPSRSWARAFLLAWDYHGAQLQRSLVRHKDHGEWMRDYLCTRCEPRQVHCSSTAANSRERSPKIRKKNQFMSSNERGDFGPDCWWWMNEGGIWVERDGLVVGRKREKDEKFITLLWSFWFGREEMMLRRKGGKI